MDAAGMMQQLTAIQRVPRLVWQQVYDDVTGDIRSGALAVGDRLPAKWTWQGAAA
jgi:DNA-binding GntR family transcriptional regulator